MMYPQQHQVQMNVGWQQPMPGVVPVGYPMMYPTQFYQPNSKWAGNTARGLGITLIVFGVISIICNIVYIPLNTYGFLGYTGVGLWGGVFLIATGIVTLVAGVKRTNGLIIATMVMSIFTIFLDLSMLGLSAGQVGSAQSYYSYYYWRQDTVSLAFGSVFLLISICCFGILLAVSILTCRGVACRTTPGTFPVMMYNPGMQPGFNTGSQIIMMQPMNGQQMSPPPTYTMQPEVPEKHQ